MAGLIIMLIMEAVVIIGGIILLILMWKNETRLVDEVLELESVIRSAAPNKDEGDGMDIITNYYEDHL